jgi:hypothetical protein
MKRIKLRSREMANHTMPGSKECAGRHSCLKLLKSQRTLRKYCMFERKPSFGLLEDVTAVFTSGIGRKPSPFSKKASLRKDQIHASRISKQEWYPRTGENSKAESGDNEGWGYQGNYEAIVSGL